MPSWLLQLLITIAIKVGIPYLVKLIPNIPKEVLDVIEQLLSDLKDPKKSNSAAKKAALIKVKKQLGNTPDGGDIKK